MASRCPTRHWLVPSLLLCSQLLASRPHPSLECLLLWTPPPIPATDADEHRHLLLGLAFAGRRQRRTLGKAFVVGWGSSAAPLCPSGLWVRPLPVVRWRCRRVHWIARRPPLTWRRHLHRHCGYAGVRVGEAAHPGPAPGTPIGSERAPMAIDGGPPACERSPARRRDSRAPCPVPNCPAGALGLRGSPPTQQ